ncbi:hypothetical protein [Streptomyces sp. NPDC005533]|uniref:hypothetical protein n=1 Tax=Streptomyces sp. NPDC005533 TaxID=3364723 RepID=UPI0036C474E5
MTYDLIHLLVRQTSGGLYATSPQAPGFTFGRKSLKELRNDLEDALSFHFDKPGPFHVLEHHERHYVISGGELVTRIANDKYKDDREAVYARLGEIIKDDRQAKALAHGVTNPVGESVYVCALPQDTVGWLMDQLDERGDAVSAAVLVADKMLLTLPIAYGDSYGEIDGTFTLAESSFNHTTTLSEIIQATNVVTPVPLRPITRKPTTNIP